ncbi:MAG: tyrosine-protein phosphatase [Bacillota bacterium]
MIDLHCHILPGLDDGPPGIETSLELARAAVNEGIHTIAATPHCIPEVFFNERQAVLEAVAEFQGRLDAEHVPLKIAPGMEVHLTLDLAERITKGSVLTLNDAGKYILLEFPMNTVPRYAEQVIFELMLKGIKPIIAHPERNREIIENPNLLYGFMEKGCLIQVTAGSLTGKFGSRVQQRTRDFVQLGWVDFIASDAHDPLRRPFMLKEAWAAAKDIIGEERANVLVLGNPQKVLMGEAIGKSEVPPYHSIKGKVSRKKRSFWSGLASIFKR